MVLHIFLKRGIRVHALVRTNPVNILNINITTRPSSLLNKVTDMDYRYIDMDNCWHFLGSVGMTTHHWTAAIKHSSNNASISCTSNALGVLETIKTTLHIRPSCVWSILPNMAVIFCYSRVMIAYGSNWKTKLQTLLSSNHVGNRQIFSSSSLQHS